MRLQEIITSIQEYHPAPDIETIRKAYAFARQHHQGQARASGEAYITHLSEVAYLTTKLRLDISSIATGFLHDTVEDTDVTLEQIQREFGEDTALLVDGVTKLSKVNFSSREEQQAENFRKMLLAMARDIRVLLIKLCDRLHNMRTLGFLSEPRRMRIASETMDIYAPLAHRLGINWMKSELEDLAFRYLKQEVYENIKRNVSLKKAERERYIKEVVQLIRRELEQNGISGTVYGRSKHFYSIYQKMEIQGLNFDEIYDLIAFRILVPTTMECYAALGFIHAAWKPIPGRFKDYIAMPKTNNYQSLHTTVIGPAGKRIEIQIRTPGMHEIAETGIAAHWIYKKDGEGAQLKTKQGTEFAWLRDLVESEKLLRDPFEFISIVKEDLFPQEVFVFSPKGDVIALQAGSTPIDFAYQIHSEIGHHCAGAKVDGQQVALSYRLRNGNTVEVITSARQTPNKDWLNIVVTSKAKQRIRTFLRAEEQAKSVAVGKELLAKDLPKVKISFNKALKSGKLAKVAEGFGLGDTESLFAEIGHGKITTKQIITKLLPEDDSVEDKLSKDETALQKIFHRAAKTFRDRSVITVNGLDDVVFRFARCCEPLPGEELVGYVTRGRGVTVHRRGCPQTYSFDSNRIIEVTWDREAKTERRVRLRVLSRDQVGILASITQTISVLGANIVTAHVSTHPDGKALHSFEIMVSSSNQLEQLTRALEKIDGIIRIERGRKREDDEQ